MKMPHMEGAEREHLSRSGPRPGPVLGETRQRAFMDNERKSKMDDGANRSFPRAKFVKF